MGGKAPLAIAVLMLCGCGRGDRIVVGSKNFTEQLLLGEIMAQHLEKRTGKKVERRLNLGGTLLAHEALLGGKIDLYPEYTGTALAAVLKENGNGPAREVLEKVRAGYRKWNVEWLDPLGFNNTFAMVVRGEDARALGIKTLSQASGRAWVLGAGYEFAGRADGLPGVQKTYRLNFTRTVTMDLGLLYQALESRQVDIAAANSTDGLIAAKDFVILDDDKRFFPPYEAAFLLRGGLAEEVGAAARELSGKLGDEAMRRLNYEVVGKHRPAAEVAREFLSRLEGRQ